MLYNNYLSPHHSNPSSPSNNLYIQYIEYNYSIYSINLALSLTIYLIHYIHSNDPLSLQLIHSDIISSSLYPTTFIYPYHTLILTLSIPIISKLYLFLDLNPFIHLTSSLHSNYSSILTILSSSLLLYHLYLILS